MSEQHTAENDVCPTPGCSGDPRYAAPGRGHANGCDYPRSLLARVAAEEEAHADDNDRPHYRARPIPPEGGKAMTAEKDTHVERIVADLLLTDALTGNDEGTPTHYTVHADDVPHLVRTVLALAEEIHAERVAALSAVIPPGSTEEGGR